MAEKNHKDKINQSHSEKDEQTRSSSISSSSSSASYSPNSSPGLNDFLSSLSNQFDLIEKGQTIVGAFKPFK